MSKQQPIEITDADYTTMDQITEVVTDADYPGIEAPEMKVVNHKLWPVSYIYKGERYDALYFYKPNDEKYWVGEPIIVGVSHPVEMPESAAKKARISELKAELIKLEGLL